MKCKLLLMSFALLAGSTANAQVTFSEDPNTSIEMDIQAKADAAELKLSTFSLNSQMFHGANVVIKLMDGTILELTGTIDSDNLALNSDVGHGFADRFVSKATLHLKPEQAELFKHGVKSVQIRMTPYSFYHEWEQDELGQPLYARYHVTKESVMFKLKEKDMKKKKKESRK